MTQLEKSLSQDIEKWKKKCTELESENRYLNEKVNVLNNKIFGRKSEKTSVVFNADQLNLFNEAETEAKASAPEPEPNEIEVSGHKRRKKQQSHQQEILKSMPHEKVVFDVAPENQICSRCGGKLMPLGEKLIRTEVEFIPLQEAVGDVHIYYAHPYSSGAGGQRGACANLGTALGDCGARRGHHCWFL